jgi:SAM-dependent methyltransferase
MFNTIYTVNTFYFWKNPARCFAEIKRILKPDGLFINVIYSKNHLDKIAITKFGFSKYTVEELEQITAQSGLKIIKIVEIQKNKSYCVLSKNVKTDIQAGGTT